jgi:hypothetical protein
LACAIRHDEAGTKPRQQGFRNPSAFKEAHDQSKHHPEWQPIQKQADNIPWAWEQTEEHQCKLGNGNQPQQCTARLVGGISEITRIPMNLLSA